MKRFFCSICKAIKHVRVMPDDVTRPNAAYLLDRIGTCRRHHGEVPHHRKPRTVYTKKSKMPAVEAKVKSKRGGK